MAAHRFWRIAIRHTVSVDFRSMSDIEFRTVPGTSLRFSGGTASASSAYAGGENGPAASATDTALASNGFPTWWATAPGALSTNDWWQYDYGAGNAVDVAEIAITARGDSSADQTADLFDIQNSDDGASWVTVVRRKASPWSVGQTQVFSAVASPTVWNVADSGAGILLGVDQLTASEDGVVNSGAWRSVRSTSSKAAGKFYFEATINALTTGMMVGLANAAATLASFVGGDANGIGWQPGFHAIWNNSSQIADNGTTTVGQTIGIAADIVAGKRWFYNPSTGLWNNAALSAENPATGAGGLVAIVLTGELFAGYSVVNSSSQDSATANFGAAAFVHPLPSGFTAWDPAAVVVAPPSSAATYLCIMS